MGKPFRQFLLFVVATAFAGLVWNPLAAMLSEPFFEATFDSVGLDTEDWARPAVLGMRAFLADPTVRLWLMLVIAFGLGAWAHYGATRWDRRREVRAHAGDALTPSEGPSDNGTHHLAPLLLRASLRKAASGHAETIVDLTFGRNATDVTVRLDYQNGRGMAGGWTEPHSFLLDHFDRVAKGQKVHVVVTKLIDAGGDAMAWNADRLGDERQSVLLPTAFTRCWITVMSGGDEGIYRFVFMPRANEFEDAIPLSETVFSYPEGRSLA